MTSSDSDSDQPTKKRQKVEEELNGSEEEETDQLDSDEKEGEEAPEPNAHNPFLSLPVEIMDRIVSYLDRHRQGKHLALVQSSADLYRRYRLELVIDHFKECQNMHQVFMVDDAIEGQFGWHPFIVTDAIRGDPEFLYDHEEEWALVGYIEFDLTEYHPDKATREYLPLQVTEYELDVDDEGDWFGPRWHLEEYVDWEELRGRFVKATPEKLKKRFTCAECKGSGTVIYGSLEVATRWPGIPFHDFQFDAPCPRCTVHRLSAEELNEEVKQEAMEEMMAEWSEMEAVYDDYY